MKRRFHAEARRRRGAEEERKMGDNRLLVFVFLPRLYSRFISPLVFCFMISALSSYIFLKRYEP
jgi:hypothetical protein